MHTHLLSPPLYLSLSPSPTLPLTRSLTDPLPLLSSLSRAVLQIEYLGTPDRVLHAVLAGDADVGLVHSGFLEEAAQQLKVAWEDITVLSQDVVRNYGERYPYYSSTPVYPDYAVVLSDSAPPEVRIGGCVLQNQTELCAVVLVVSRSYMCFSRSHRSLLHPARLLL